MGQRITWIDNLKGFILLLVCFYHIQLPWSIIDMTSSFRMTTFFFLSGLLFSDRRFDSIASFVKHKSKCLLFPYIYLSIIFAFINPVVIFEIIKKDAGSLTYNVIIPSLPDTWNYYLYRLLCSFNTIVYGHSADATYSLWFVLTLYIVSCSFFCFNYIVKKKLHGLLYKVCLGGYALLFLVFAWFCYKSQLSFPLNLQSFFSSSFFFVFGVLSKPYVHQIQKFAISENKAMVFSIFCVMYFVSVFLGRMNGTMSLVNNSLGDNLIILIILSVIGIYSIVLFFILISNYSGKLFSAILGIFRNVANNALVVLPIHVFISVLYREICVYYGWEYNPYICLLWVIIGLLISIPLFRCKLYFLIGKDKISIKKSLSIR